jgi:proteasome accessory factor C
VAVSDAFLRRLRRLLVLLPAAARASRAGEGLPLARAAELCGARSEAQVVEDVEAVAGLWVDPASAEDVVDVYVEDGKVHVTYAQAFGAPPAFSLAEGAVLLGALLPFEKGGGKAVRSAVAKLRRAIPEELRPEADRLARGLDVVREPPGPWADVLRDAIDRRVEVTLDYRAVADEGGASAPRRVEPRLLFHRDGAWYLAAWSVEKEEEHLYRLDRIARAEAGTRAFGEHRGPPLARYARRDLYFETGEEREVRIRYTGHAARVARERWGDRAREVADGAVVVPMKVTPGSYLYGVLLGHGGEATVEGPEDVAAAFRARVDALRHLYRE